MKIAVVHSFYRSAIPSGENRIVRDQLEALQVRGHSVLLIDRTSDDIRRPWDHVRTAALLAGGRGADPTEEIERFRPDVVHVHNLFPSFGTRWVSDCPAPVVATLHNFRPLCANATLYRDGHSCTLCPDGQWWSSVQNACYRDSRLATLPLVPGLRRGVSGNPLFQHARRLIVLSERARGIYEDYGVPHQKLRLIPNGIPDVSVAAPATRSGWVCVGRLSTEKGVPELIKEWPDGTRLDIIGSGPAADLVEDAIRGRAAIRALGALDSDAVHRQLSQAVGLVIPSMWPEGLPLVLGEALRAGTPVLARTGSSAADFVQQHGGGAVYTTGEQLAARVASWNHRSSEASARTAFLQHWSMESWLALLEALYDEVAE